MKDNFSLQSDKYAKYRPTYPNEFFGYHWHGHSYRSDSLPLFGTMLISCPSCKRQSFLMSVVLSKLGDNEDAVSQYLYEFFKLFNLPTQESQFETKDIPEEYDLLKKTIIEAKFNLENSQYMSATIMFRRGLQILAKDILGAKGHSLYQQLEWLKENENKLKISLSELFHDNSKLVRLVGNQGAHPDEDKDLHEFNEADANSVHDLFLLLINEVFVMPEKMRLMKKELSERRKLK